MRDLVNLLIWWPVIFVFVVLPVSFVGALVAWLVPSCWRALPILGLALVWPIHLAVNFGSDPKLGQPHDIVFMCFPPVLLAMLLGVWLVNWIRRLP